MFCFLKHTYLGQKIKFIDETVKGNNSKVEFLNKVSLLDII